MSDAAAELDGSSAPAVPTEAAAPEVARRAPTVGTLLQLARESAGMSRAEVAGQLKFSVKQIEAIETDNYAALGGKTFVRGLVRTCAKLLNADSGPILAALDDSGLPPEMQQVVEDPKGIPFPSPAPAVSPVLRYIVMSLGAMAAVVLLLYMWHGDELFSGPAMSKPQQKPAPAARAEERTQTAATVVLTPEVVETPAVVERAPASSPMPASAPAPKAARGAGDKLTDKPVESGAAIPAAAPTAGSGAGRRILISFDRDAWVEVRDAGGRILFSQIISPARSR